MDINLPGINGIEATRRIVAAAPSTTVLLLSTYRAEDLPATRAPAAPSGTSTRRTSVPRPCGSGGTTATSPTGAASRASPRSRRRRRAQPATVVPFPASERTSSVPPIAPSRSAMFTNPWPSPPTVTSNPAPSSMTSKRRDAVVVYAHHELARRRRRACRRSAAPRGSRSTPRSPPPARTATPSRALEIGEQRRARGRGAQRLLEAAIAQQRRVDAVRELAELGERDLRVGRAAPPASRSPLGIAVSSCRASPSFTASATRCCCAPSCRLRSMWRRDSSDAATMRARDAWSSCVGGPHLGEARLERGVELAVVDRDRDLAGDVGEDLLLRLGERVGVDVAPADHEPEELARVREGHDAGRVGRVGERGEPHLEPGVARDAGAGDDRGFVGGEVQRRADRGAGPRRRARARRGCRSTPRPP